MLESLKALDGFTIHAIDGEIGATEDVLWDDAAWMVRYLVIDTGKWLPGRRVLISPASVEFVGWDEREIRVNLTSDQVRNSPDAASDEPVSRQHEEALSAYYGWPSYWTMDPYGYEPMSLPTPLPEGTAAAHSGDPHLRSLDEVKGYRIEGLDGEIGRVADVEFDDATWRIAFLVGDCGSWLHKRLVRLKPEWVTKILWDESHVIVHLTRDSVREQHAATTK